MAQIGLKQILVQFSGVGEVAVMGQGNAVRRVDVERLCQRRAGASGGWIAHMANTNVTRQTLHMAGTENIPYQAVGFLLRQLTAVARHDASGVLAAVLQYGQSIVQL